MPAKKKPAAVAASATVRRLTESPNGAAAPLTGELKKYPGLTSVAGVCGGDPCVGGTRVAVWMLYRAKLRGASDRSLLRTYPFLTRDELATAWKYAEDHLPEMERAIAENSW